MLTMFLVKEEKQNTDFAPKGNNSLIFQVSARLTETNKFSYMLQLQRILYMSMTKFP